MDVHCLVQALQVLYSEREVGGEVGLPRHWMRDFFLASLCLEVQENQEALSRLQVWSCMTLISSHLRSIRCKTSYLHDLAWQESTIKFNGPFVVFALQ